MRPPEIQQLLPHRHPILLVDRVIDLSEPDRVVTIKAVTLSEPCFGDLAETGNGGGYAFPPALMLESFVQSGAIMLCHLWRREQQELEAFGASGTETLVFVGARDVRYHRSVLPGDVMRHEVLVHRPAPDVALISGHITVDGHEVASIGRATLARRGIGPSKGTTKAGLAGGQA